MDQQEFQLKTVAALARIETTLQATARLVHKHEEEIDRLTLESEVAKRLGKRGGRWAGLTALGVGVLEMMRRIYA